MDLAGSDAATWAAGLRARSRAIALPDGRRLGVVEYGEPTAPPVLYFHGWPSSRFEPGLLDIGAVRLIAVDRPGYGLSDPPARARRLGDWPADVAALADALGLDRFALFGMSGGGPFAATAAAALPERVSALALVSAIGPQSAPGMDAGRMGLLLGFGRNPWRQQMVFTLARHLLRSSRGEETLLAARRHLRRADSSDAAALTDVFARRLLECWREGLSRSVEGAAADARIYGEPWPFEPERIRVPTTIWHGEADRVVPASIGRHYAARVRHAQAHFPADEGHVSLIVNHHHAILETLLGAR